jgi:hypothetical protein
MNYNLSQISSKVCKAELLVKAPEEEKWKILSVPYPGSA